MSTDDLAKLVNRSGFLFQIGVEQHVRATTKDHDWEVIAREYPWSAANSGRSGFIDFIAARAGLRCVVECKRTQGGEWIFLVPDPPAQTKILRTLWSYVARDNVRGWGWNDLDFEPATLESEFCIVRGASDEDKPMLERIAGDLVRSAESLAREELATRDRGQGAHGYLPVIVTNAKLYACRVEPRLIDLASGTLPASAKFEEVSAIRFRKALPTDLAHEPESYESIKRGAIVKERSAFVVQIAALAEWLKGLRQQRSPLAFERDPWWHLES